MSVTFSVITPTIGRESLGRMLQGLVPQLETGDEVLVVGDGPQPRAREIMGKTAFVKGRGRYIETERRGLWGNPQRNLALTVVGGTHVLFVDDDDQVIWGALGLAREAVEQAPLRPHFFKMQHPRVLLWQDRRVVPGNVSGQMFVIPNIPKKFGRWTDRYEADQDFIRSTLDLHGGDASAVWREEILTIQGLAGKSR